MAAFRAALQEELASRVPLDWAMTQNNLANALRTLGERRRCESYRRAVTAVRVALQEWTRECARPIGPMMPGRCTAASS